MTKNRMIEIFSEELIRIGLYSSDDSIEDVKQYLLSEGKTDWEAAALTAMQRAVDEETATLHEGIKKLQEQFDENGYDCSDEIKLQRIQSTVSSVIEHYFSENQSLRAELERLKQSKSCVEIPKGTLQDGDVIEFKMQSRSFELSKLHSELNRLRECEAIVREIVEFNNELSRHQQQLPNEVRMKWNQILENAIHLSRQLVKENPPHTGR